MSYISPSHGVMTLDNVFEDLRQFVLADAEANYKLIVGTDSQTYHDVLFVTAIIIHRVGKGARYFYKKTRRPEMPGLRQRIFYEASLSLKTAGELTERLAEMDSSGVNVEIHLDVGRHGDTKDMIREIVGMVTGSGFEARIKPESYGASTVADRYTK